MNLSQIRQFAALTQEQLADNMNTKQTVISRLERQQDWKYSTLTAYIQAAGLKASLVLKRDGETLTIDLGKEE